MWCVPCFWGVVFVCVKNDVCEDGVFSVYICWWLNVRESTLIVCSELCPVCFYIFSECMSDICSSLTMRSYVILDPYVVVIDLPLLRVAVEGSDNPVSLEKPCQASLPPDQQGRHSLGRHPEVQYVA